MGGCLGGLVDGCADGWGYIKNLDLIEIVQFCLKIYDLWRHPHLWVSVWVAGWLGGSMAWVMLNH